MGHSNGSCPKFTLGQKRLHEASGFEVGLPLKLNHFRIFLASFRLLSLMISSTFLWYLKMVYQCLLNSALVWLYVALKLALCQSTTRFSTGSPEYSQLDSWQPVWILVKLYGFLVRDLLVRYVVRILVRKLRNTPNKISYQFVRPFMANVWCVPYGSAKNWLHV